MTDQTDLAALLHELGVGCMEPFALTRDVCVPTDPRYPMHRARLAALLLVLAALVAVVVVRR